MSINGNSYVGAIAGWVDEVLLEGIFASGTINGTSFIGGLLGVMSVDSKLYFGHNECVVNANGDYAGGITGNLSMAYIYDSYSDAGAVTGNSYVGGIAGFTGMSSIRRSYNISDVNGINNVGGLVGYSQDYDNISSSFNEGNVTGLLKVGGVVGAAGDGSNFSNLYNKGVVSGESEVAGIIGWAGSAITISNCYNVGLTIGDLNTNGILGYVEGSGNSINNSYWNVETTDQSSGGGAGAVELSTEQMKMQASYNTWDFADIWGFLEGVSYPFFKWQKVAIEIIKEGNGTIIPEGQVLVTVGEDLTLSITPEIGSYLFSIEINGSIIDLEVDPSWDANNGVLTLTSIQESQSVHITFTPYTYTITYNADGGTHVNPATFTIEDLNVTLLPASKAGYTFLGWFDNAGLTGEAVTQITEIGDVELWAKFEAIVYTITYNADGGTHDNPENFTIEDLDITLAYATKEGYSVAGWFNNAGRSGEAVTQITEIGDVELWAKFEAIVYTITYNADGGTHDNPENFTIEDLDITLANATKDGYTFAGWFNNAGLTGEAVTQITEIGDVELWAKFEAIVYNITYHADGGTHANPENFTIEDSEVTLAEASKDGYNFLGWFDNAELTGDAVTQITEIGNVELWAKFEAIVYNITYHADGGTHANPATFTIEDLDITLSDATKDGYTFAGWFNNAELTGNAVTQIT
ncbi:MAG: InlB B-repeat-containing protein, partial [Tenuifilaceae bacterium]|nr:InlB B-repeat-containing protein [Tenuifilaceae bacterium]